MATTTLQDRVKLALKVSGKSKTDLWKGCGVSSGTVTTWVKGPNQTISGVNLTNASKILGVSAEWLATGNGEMLVNASGDQVEFELTALGTDSRLSNHAFQSVKFNTNWLASEIAKDFVKDNLSIVLVHDESMQPNLHQGNFLLIDTGIHTYTQDGIYLIKSQAGNLLRRINKNLDGSLSIRSDNPIYSEETTPNLAQSNIKVLGRALFAWSQKKLT